jgi:hypothetical protein
MYGSLKHAVGGLTDQPQERLLVHRRLDDRPAQGGVLDLGLDVELAQVVRHAAERRVQNRVVDEVPDAPPVRCGERVGRTRILALVEGRRDEHEQVQSRERGRYGLPVGEVGLRRLESPGLTRSVGCAHAAHQAPHPDSAAGELADRVAASLPACGGYSDEWRHRINVRPVLRICTVVGHGPGDSGPTSGPRVRRAATSSHRVVVRARRLWASGKFGLQDRGHGAPCAEASWNGGEHRRSLSREVLAIEDATGPDEVMEAGRTSG